jgi:cytochrome c oxidase assembly protein subunit 15
MLCGVNVSDSRVVQFKKWALASTLATYFLIFVGGLVRVAGAGLGCPDWPKCFGRWIPPLSKSQLPAGLDPDTFNLVLAWIEYINRLIGVVVGILILITVFLAVKNFRTVKKIWIPGVMTLLLVVVQGWHGSIVVSSQLQPLIVSVHLLMAIIIVSLLLYITQVSDCLEFNPSLKVIQENSYRKWILLLWVAGLMQIMLGTQVRSSIEQLLTQYPLLSGSEVLKSIKFITILHASAGIIVGLLSWLVVSPLVRKPAAVPSLNLRWSSRFVLITVFLQIALGITLQLGGVRQILQVFHLWVATLFLGFVLMLYIELLYRREEP